MKINFQIQNILGKWLKSAPLNTTTEETTLYAKRVEAETAALKAQVEKLAALKSRAALEEAKHSQKTGLGKSDLRDEDSGHALQYGKWTLTT